MDDCELCHPEAARLSALLWEARESLEMWADVVEECAGHTDKYARGLIQRIDEYRQEQGWSAHGYGGEK